MFRGGDRPVVELKFDETRMNSESQLYLDRGRRDLKALEMLSIPALIVITMLPLRSRKKRQKTFLQMRVDLLAGSNGT
jgi:hypothetical protein